MNFFFCEKCGKRIDDNDLSSGKARNKKLKGVYCDSCSVGVMTLETLPISDSEANRILLEADDREHKSKQGIKRKTSGISRQFRKTAGQMDEKPRATSSPIVLLSFVCLSVLSLSIILFFIFAPKPTEYAPTHSNSKQIAAMKHESAVANSQLLVPESADKVSHSTEVSGRPIPQEIAPHVDAPVQDFGSNLVVPEDTPQAPNDLEKMAQVELDRLSALKFSNIGHEIIQKERADFQEKFGDTIVAARARDLFDNWQGKIDQVSKDNESITEKSNSQPQSDANKDALIQLGKVDIIEVNTAQPTNSQIAIIHPQVQRRTDDISPEKVTEWKILSEVKAFKSPVDSFWEVIGSSSTPRIVNSTIQINNWGQSLITARNLPMSSRYRFSTTGGCQAGQFVVGIVNNDSDPRYDNSSRTRFAPTVEAVFDSGKFELTRNNCLSPGSKETLLASREIPAKEFAVQIEFDSKSVSLVVNGETHFTGAHGLKSFSNVRFRIMGRTAPRFDGINEGVWFKSVRLERIDDSK